MTAVLTWDPVALMCPCQYGECGYCKQLGKHEKCTTTSTPKPGPTPATYITYRDRVLLLDSGPAAVHEVGHPHIWVCPCARRGHGLDVPCPGPVQLELFDLEAS